jgi:hypothetical protein
VVLCGIWWEIGWSVAEALDAGGKEGERLKEGREGMQGHAIEGLFGETQEL